MPLITGDKGGILWDAVSLANAFICEYMPSAPDAHVKVYLYGLMMAHNVALDGLQNHADIARALSMEESAVAQAFRYWERCRLILRTQDQPPQYQYMSVQQTLLHRQDVPQDEAYMEFAQALYGIFGEKRKLHGNETVLAYEWVEQLGLPREIVLMMVQYLISTRGVSFGFKEAQKLALELCEQHITTIEAAEMLFSRSEAAWKGSKKVLSRMGKPRPPSLDETDLYVKWTKEWHFAPKAVEAACSEMTSGDPSFKYLDRILERIRMSSGKASISAAQMEKQLAGEKAETERIREMLAACGIKSAVVDEGKRLVYRDMLRCGGHDIILLAAEAVGKRRGGHSLDSVAELLTSWHEKGLLTAADVQAHLQSVQQQNAAVKALYLAAGREAAPKLSDRELLQKWRQDWSFDDVLLHRAAEYARDMDKPFLYMDKVLGGWHATGITTLQQAEEEHLKRKGSASAAASRTAPKGGKTVIEQQYGQRTYDPTQYSGPSADLLEEAKKQ